MSEAKAVTTASSLPGYRDVRFAGTLLFATQLAAGITRGKSQFKMFCVMSPSTIRGSPSWTSQQ